MNNAHWDVLYFNKVILHVTDFQTYRLFLLNWYCFCSAVKDWSLFRIFLRTFFRMKKAAGRWGLLWRSWRLARSSACIMYLALLLCQSHVNLCAFSIQGLDVRQAIIHSTATMLCIIFFSFKALYCVTFCRKVFCEEVYIKWWLSHTCMST